MAHGARKSARQRKAKKAIAIVVARSLLSQLGTPHGRRGRCRRAAPLQSVGAASIGALALGAVSMGAGAIGALAVGKLAIKRGTVGSLRIEELTVGRLQVDELNVLSRSATP